MLLNITLVAQYHVAATCKYQIFLIALSPRFPPFLLISPEISFSRVYIRTIIHSIKNLNMLTEAFWSKRTSTCTHACMHEYIVNSDQTHILITQPATCSLSLSILTLGQPPFSYTVVLFNMDTSGPAGIP